LLKYREFGAAADRRSIIRTPARHVATIEIRSNQHVLPRPDEPDANVVVAAPVPTPQATEPPGASKTSTGGADLQAASVWGDDNPPRIIKRAVLAIVDPATGTATVEVDIDTDGTVMDVKLLQSSGDPAVDQAALDAARASTFAPATVNGLPVHGTLTIDYPPPASSTT